jgi:hypothetical protein
MQFDMQNMHTMQLKSICKICKKQYAKYACNMQVLMTLLYIACNMQNMQKKICTMCKICKRYFQYAKYAPPTLLILDTPTCEASGWLRLLVTRGFFSQACSRSFLPAIRRRNLDHFCTDHDAEVP